MNAYHGLLILLRSFLWFGSRWQPSDDSAPLLQVEVDIEPNLISENKIGIILALDRCMWKCSSWGLSRNCNRNLQTSKALLKSQAQGTSSFTSTAVVLRIFHGRFRSGLQRVRGGRVAVKAVSVI